MTYALQRRDGSLRRNLSAVELVALAKLGELDGEDLVQRAGESRWVLAGGVEALREILREQERPRRDWGDIARELKPLVPLIEVADGSGSGLLVSSDGLILTNRHVIEPHSAAMARFHNGNTLRAVLVASSPSWDLALMRCPLAGQAFFDLDERLVRHSAEGTEVVAIGHPLGFQFTVTRGVVSVPIRSALECMQVGLRVDPRMGAEFVQLDLQVHQGMSGGPCLDATGALIGLNTWGDPRERQSINFAVPARAIRAWITEIRGRIASGAIRLPSDADIHSADVRPARHVAVELALGEFGEFRRKPMSTDGPARAWSLTLDESDDRRPLEIDLFEARDPWACEDAANSLYLRIQTKALETGRLDLHDLLKFQSQSGLAKAALDDDGQLVVRCERAAADIDASEVVGMIVDVVRLERVLRAR